MSEYNGFGNEPEPKTKPLSKLERLIDILYTCIGYGAIIFSVLIFAQMFFDHLK